MRIDHLVDGRALSSPTYFETVNPASQEVLAEVAAGGAAEVDAAVSAAKRAFPAWAARPASERAALLRRLGDLISRYAPEIARLETQDTGQPIAQTGKQLIPRSADNFHYFAEMCVRVDGQTYPHSYSPELHLVSPRRRLRPDLALERAIHDGYVEDRPRPRLWQHRSAEDE